MSLAASEPPNSKSSGREPGSSTGRPIQKSWSSGAEQRLAPVFAVEQHAEARPARRDLRRGLDGEQLEGADALARRAGVVGDFFELGAMVDRQRHDRRRLGRGGSSPNGCG